MKFVFALLIVTCCAVFALGVGVLTILYERRVDHARAIERRLAWKPESVHDR